MTLNGVWMAVISRYFSEFVQRCLCCSRASSSERYPTLSSYSQWQQDRSHNPSQFWLQHYKQHIEPPLFAAALRIQYSPRQPPPPL